MHATNQAFRSGARRAVAAAAVFLLCAGCVRCRGTERPAVAAAPAPGTADVRALVVSCDEAAGAATCLLRIKRVFAYGPATPVLPEGAEVRARWAAGPSGRAGNRVDVRLRHLGAGQEPPAGAGAAWTVETTAGSK